MNRKAILFIMLICSISAFVTPRAMAQGVEDQNQTKKNLTRPDKCDVPEVDKFVNSCFDAYDESKKISEDINFIKVEGDGETTPFKITNGKGETLTKEAALQQFGDLAIRAKKQNDNIKTLEDLQKPASEATKKCSMTKKPKATKNLAKGGEALTEVTNQTKNQIVLIDKQIGLLNKVREADSKAGKESKLKAKKDANKK